MGETYKRITIHGRLKFKSHEDLKVNWFDNEVKHITCLDFSFILIDDDFFEKYKHIQDSNDLEFLKITKIEELTSTYEELY
jgi:hypothetical protein